VQSGVPAMGWTIHRASSVEGPRSSFLGRHRNPPTGLLYFLYNFLFLFDLSFPFFPQAPAGGRWKEAYFGLTRRLHGTLKIVGHLNSQSRAVADVLQEQSALDSCHLARPQYAHAR
jgi:hypothetical protein